MIKAEDLRIGDLARYGKDVVSIQAVHADGLVCFADGKDQICVEHVLLEPIPLTPEILEKNGFKVGVPGECYMKFICKTLFYKRYISVELKPNDWAVFIKYTDIPDYALIRHVQYVHELQHILWALGLDAEIKL